MQHRNNGSITSTLLCALALAGTAAATTACDKAAETTTPDEATPGTVDMDGGADGEEAEADDLDSPTESAEASEAQTESALTIASFEEAIQAHLDDVGECYAAAKERDAELTGTYQAHFTIGLDGKVTEVKAADASDINDDELNACVLEKSANWQFDKPGHGEPMEMNFPFAFGE